MPIFSFVDVPSEVADALTERARAAGRIARNGYASISHNLSSFHRQSQFTPCGSSDPRTRCIDTSSGPPMGRSAFNSARLLF